MKKLLALLVIGASVISSYGQGKTNSVFSQTNMLYIIQTNIAAAQFTQSNALYSASNDLYTLYLANSNVLWSITNVTFSTNINVLMPGSNTIQFRYTNGILRDVTAP